MTRHEKESRVTTLTRSELRVAEALVYRPELDYHGCAVTIRFSGSNFGVRAKQVYLKLLGDKVPPRTKKRPLLISEYKEILPRPPPDNP